MIVAIFSLQTDYVWFWVDLAFSRNTLEEASGYDMAQRRGVSRLEAWTGKAGGVSISVLLLWERDFIGTGRGHAFYTWL